jgi:hypothetical protein
MADFEDGMFAGDDYIDPDAVPSWHGTPYVTAMLKGRPCEFSLKGGSAAPTAAGDAGASTGAGGGWLSTLYEGARPQHHSPMMPDDVVDYEPM